jgi:hypothetical protein
VGDDAGDACREGDLTERLVGLAVAQTARGEVFARRVEPALGFRRGEPAEQQDELFAPVARDVAVVVRTLGEDLGDHLEHAIAGVMTVGVVDALEMVDVAECQAQCLTPGGGLGVLAFEFDFERPAIGQPGQVILFGVAAGLA